MDIFSIPPVLAEAPSWQTLQNLINFCNKVSHLWNSDFERSLKYAVQGKDLRKTLMDVKFLA